MKRHLLVLLAGILSILFAASAQTSEETREVLCPEQNISILIPAGLETAFDIDTLMVYIDEFGSVPNIQIYRRSRNLPDPISYVREAYSSYMKDKYGDQLCDIIYYEQFGIGGKVLYGAKYVYDANGTRMGLLHLLEVRDSGDVEYTARFCEGESAETMAVLNGIIRSYMETDIETEERIELSLTPVQPLISQTVLTGDNRFTIVLPKDWEYLTKGEDTAFALKAWDPKNPSRTLYIISRLEPFFTSEASKSACRAEAEKSWNTASSIALISDAPVLEEISVPSFLRSVPAVYSFANQYSDSGFTIDPDVIPLITGIRIIENMPNENSCPPGCPDNSIVRITYEGPLNQLCEGWFTAQPCESSSDSFIGVDETGSGEGSGFCTVYDFIGFTAPFGEMDELEPILAECLSSFDFTPQYVNQTIQVSEEEKESLLARGQRMQAIHDAMVSAWKSRDTAHDIAFQKWSDSFRKYERLYDPFTGSVYLAETGFYDFYDQNRRSYVNSDLQLADDSSSQYYLCPADYYINN